VVNFEELMINWKNGHLKVDETTLSEIESFAKDYMQFMAVAKTERETVTQSIKEAREGVNIVVAHVDAPRLDLKPRPLKEDEQIAILETHYYGGIKNFHWVSTPLALHGVVVKTDGTNCCGRQG